MAGLFWPVQLRMLDRACFTRQIGAKTLLGLACTFEWAGRAIAQRLATPTLLAAHLNG